MNLQPLTITDRPMVDEFLKKYPPLVSELTFTNLFVWQQGRPVFWDILADTLAFFVRKESGIYLFGPPVGPAPLPVIIDDCGGMLAGGDRIARTAAQNLSGKDITIIDDRNNADYVYSVHDLATLSGREFAKKRNHIKHCLDGHECRYEEISAATIDECMDMQDLWCKSRDCGNDPGLCGEYQAIAEAFRRYGEFSLLGGAIRVNGAIAAFALGEALSPDTAVCHFEKALPGIQGLNQLINQWFAKYSLKNFTFVNREQDLGIPGLRQAKESYHPHHLVEKVRFFMAAEKDSQESILACPDP